MVILSSANKENGLSTIFLIASWIVIDVIFDTLLPLSLRNLFFFEERGDVFWFAREYKTMYSPLELFQAH